MKTKVCSKCKEEKSVGEFNKNKRKKDGLCVYCKICVSDKYKHDKVRIDAINKKYRENNKEKIAALLKKYYQENKNKLLARSKVYRQGNKEKIVAYKKKYFQENKERLILEGNCRQYFHRSGIKLTDVPKEFIELYKLYLQLKREVKNGTAKSI